MKLLFLELFSLGHLSWLYSAGSVKKILLKTHQHLLIQAIKNSNNKKLSIEPMTPNLGNKDLS